MEQRRPLVARRYQNQVVGFGSIPVDAGRQFIHVSRHDVQFERVEGAGRWRGQTGRDRADKVDLISAAKIIRGNIRNTDIAARYGGDEFCVMLTETDKEAAFLKAEKIRLEMKDSRFLNNDKQPDKNPSVSVGIAAFPVDAGDREKLLKKVDDALYRSKKEGRNRVSRA